MGTSNSEHVSSLRNKCGYAARGTAVINCIGGKLVKKIRGQKKDVCTWKNRDNKNETVDDGSPYCGYSDSYCSGDEDEDYTKDEEKDEAGVGKVKEEKEGEKEGDFERDIFPELRDPSDTGVLTRELIVEYGDGAETIEEVTQVICRGKNIHTVELEDAVCLEIASFSNNDIRDMHQFTVACCGLRELNLNFNRIEDVSPLAECEMLKKLNLSHNQIRNIDALEALELSSLSLFQNKLDDFDRLLETIKNMPLESLDVGRNPCTTEKGARPRYSLIKSLGSLKRLDQQDVLPLDRQLATKFFDDITEAMRPRTAPPLRGTTSTSTHEIQPQQGSFASRAAWCGPAVGGGVSGGSTGSTGGLLAQIPALRSEIPKIDYDDPTGTIDRLVSHCEQLLLRKQTIQVEKENLERQLANELAKKQRKDNDAKNLRAESQNMFLIMEENEQLKAKVRELERRVGDPITTRRLEQRVERLTAYCTSLHNDKLETERPRPMTSCGVPSLPPGRELDSDLAAMVEKNRATIESLKREKQELERIEEEVALENRTDRTSVSPVPKETKRKSAATDKISLAKENDATIENSKKDDKEARHHYYMGPVESYEGHDEDVPIWEALPRAPLSPNAQSESSLRYTSKGKIQCFIHSGSLSSDSNGSLSESDSLTLQANRCLSHEEKVEGYGNGGPEDTRLQDDGTNTQEASIQKTAMSITIKRAPKSRALDERFKCPVCVRTFLSTDAVDTHMERRHSNRVVI